MNFECFEYAILKEAFIGIVCWLLIKTSAFSCLAAAHLHIVANIFGLQHALPHCRYFAPQFTGTLTIQTDIPAIYKKTDINLRYSQFP